LPQLTVYLLPVPPQVGQVERPLPPQREQKALLLCMV
jgi:hypothetical protein